MKNFTPQQLQMRLACGLLDECSNFFEEAEVESLSKRLDEATQAITEVLDSLEHLGLAEGAHTGPIYLPPALRKPPQRYGDPLLTYALKKVANG